MTLPVPEKLTVTSLECPECRRALTGLDADRVFSCRSCRLAFQPAGSAFERLPLRVAAPEEKARRGVPTLLLPFWVFDVTCTLEWADAVAKPPATPSVVLIEAFSLFHAAYLGRPGLELTRRKATPTPAGVGEDMPLVAGVRRTLDDARTLRTYYVLSVVDRQQDVSGVKLRIEEHEAALWGIPFQDAGRELVCALTGMAFPATLFGDLEELRGFSRSGA